MKKIFLSWAFALTTLITVSSCSSSTNEQPATEAGTPAQTEATAPDTAATATQTGQMAYICPMECEGSASMKPGQCPVCGMDLVKNPAASADTKGAQ